MSYRAFWQRRCRAAAAGAVLKPQGGNCAVLPYIICGGELFVDRRSKSITISTVAAALQKIATRQAAGEGHHRPQKDWLLWCQLRIPDVLNLGIIPQPETGKEILGNTA